MMSAPASANTSMYLSGSEIIRWTSNGSFVAFLIEATIAGPKVMFGTKCPSITSTCSSSTCFSTFFTSSPSLEKSAESIDGAILTMICCMSAGYLNLFHFGFNTRRSRRQRNTKWNSKMPVAFFLFLPCQEFLKHRKNGCKRYEQRNCREKARLHLAEHVGPECKQKNRLNQVKHSLSHAWHLSVAGI